MSKQLAIFLSVFLASVMLLSAPPEPKDVEPIVKRSPHWPAVRAEHLRKNGVCAACGQDDDLNVHHIEPFHFNPALELDPSNLITLCVDGVGHTNCHLMIGHGGNYKCANPRVVEDAKRFRAMLKNRICEVRP